MDPVWFRLSDVSVLARESINAAIMRWLGHNPWIFTITGDDGEIGTYSFSAWNDGERNAIPLHLEAGRDLARRLLWEWGFVAIEGDKTQMENYPAILRMKLFEYAPKDVATLVRVRK